MSGQRTNLGFDPKWFQIGAALGPNAGVRDWYEKVVLKLVEDMNEETINEVADLFERAGRYGKLEVNSLSSQARILLNRVSDVLEARFAAKAQGLAEGMLKRTLRANAAGLRVSLKDLAQGVTIKPAWISGALKEKLKAAVTGNVSLIKSIGQEQEGVRGTRRPPN